MKEGILEGLRDVRGIVGGKGEYKEDRQIDK